MAAKKQRTEQGDDLRKQGAAWLDRIKAAAKDEKTWIDDADRAVKAYSGEISSDASSTTISLGDVYDFNILFSNVETIVPAVINSPPAPDIRRRFSDDDPAAKDVAELMERVIRIQIDDSKLQTEMEAEAHDAFLAGRGVIRLRFKSDFIADTKDIVAEVAGEDDETADDEAPAAPPPVERLANERITFEAVSWRDYRHGPAKRWDERPWEAFRFCVPREDENDSFDGNLIRSQLDEHEVKTRSESKDEITGWEIWCKKTRKVKFIDDDGVILKTVDDPLGLSTFFPSATPMQPIEMTGRLMPINPFSVYRKLADELDLTTKRINIITKHMKVKGWYPGNAGDIANMLNAEDVEFVPIAEPEIWAQNGGLAAAVAFWPVEKFIVVLRELYVAREQTKQAIYEITGISDIVRGATKANETLGAQQIKTQWGSLRIQKMQRMLERTARDLFVMMAEIIPAKFSAETLQKMTGVQLIPTQQDMMPVQPQMQPNMPPEAQQQAMQQAQEAEQARQARVAHMQAVAGLLNEPLGVLYRIDVESDSTVRADLTRQKQEMTEFMQAASAFWAAAPQAIQAGALTQEAASEIFASVARMFNLNKSVEDTLDKMIADAKAKAQQPPQPSPEQQAAEAEAKAREQEAQAKAADREAEMQMKQQEHGLKMTELQVGLEVKKEEASIKLKGDRAKFMMDQKVRKQDRAIKAKEAGLPAEPDEPDEEDEMLQEVMQEMIKQREANAQTTAQMAQAIEMLARAVSAPKRLVRDQQGKPAGVETVLQ